jgi:anaerobic selenocysteine-containing dehydrogenase
VPFASRTFPTETGRFHFIQNFRPIERPASTLRLLAPKTRRMMNSQVLPEDLPDEPRIRLNPATGSRLGAAGGDMVRVRSSVGEVLARVVTDPQVHPEVVLFVPAAWRGELSGVNLLREARLSDLGDGAAFNETTVEILPLPA